MDMLQHLTDVLLAGAGILGQVHVGVQAVDGGHAGMMAAVGLASAGSKFLSEVACAPQSYQYFKTLPMTPNDT